MKKIILLLFIFSFLILTVSVVSAATQTNPQPATPVSGDAVQLTNPLTGNKNSDSIPVLLGKIISYAMGIIGSLALFMFIYGGITWMLSGGNAEQVTKGKNIVIWAALGIALIFMAYALVRFVISAIGGTT